MRIQCSGILYTQIKNTSLNAFDFDSEFSPIFTRISLAYIHTVDN